MSEKTAELWARAKDCDASPAEIEAHLAAFNKDIQWDRENLTSTSVGESESVAADD